MVREKRKEIQRKCSKLHGEDIPAVHMCFEKEIEANEKELFRGARFAEEADVDEDIWDNSDFYDFTH